MNSSTGKVVIGVLALLGSAGALRWTGGQLHPPVASRQHPDASLANRGGWLLVAGGYQTILADGFWLEANRAWERRDAAETARFIRLATTADPQCLYFWLNGARMLAYDLPAWERAAGFMPATVAARRQHEAADGALALLQQAAAWHRQSPDLFIEMGNVAWRAQGDLAAAAQHYRRAALLPGAPAHAARVHAELLVATGRRREARDWLRQLLPRLRPEDPDARIAVVRERLQALEAGPDTER